MIDGWSGDHFCWIIDGLSGPLGCFCLDGDLLVCIAGVLRYRTCSSVKNSKVKSHAIDALVADGRVRREDKDGNDAADVAADCGKLRHRRNLLRVKRELYPILICLA